MDAIRVLNERLRMVQMGGCPRFLLHFDETGVHISEVINVNHVHRSASISKRNEAHYETYPIASGQDLTEAVKNARVAHWTSSR